MNFTIRRETKISIKCFTKCPINFHRNNWENSILFYVNTWENNAWNNAIEPIFKNSHVQKLYLEQHLESRQIVAHPVSK